jgi:hypothetical protein
VKNWGLILAGFVLVMVPRVQADDGVRPMEAVSTSAAPVLKPVGTKLVRPGISGVASIPAQGGCLAAESFSREANASGVETSGLGGYFECSITKRLAIFVLPTHWLASRGLSGSGDLAFGPRYVLNRETPHVPLVSLGYGYKHPMAGDGLGSGRHDHKATVYADKSLGATRLTANFVVKWEGHSDGYLLQYLESLGVLQPVYGNIAVAAQTYYSSSAVGRYGGAVAAGVYRVHPNLNFHLGLEHGFGPKSANLGVVCGVTYLYRGPQR